MVGCKTNSSYILRVLHSNEVKLYLKVTQNSRKVHNEDNTIHQWILFLAQLKHLLSKSLIIAQIAEPNRTEPNRAAWWEFKLCSKSQQGSKNVQTTAAAAPLRRL